MSSILSFIQMLVGFVTTFYEYTQSGLVALIRCATSTLSVVSLLPSFIIPLFSIIIGLSIIKFILGR